MREVVAPEYAPFGYFKGIGHGGETYTCSVDGNSTTFTTDYYQSFYVLFVWGTQDDMDAVLSAYSDVWQVPKTPNGEPIAKVLLPSPGPSGGDIVTASVSQNDYQSYEFFASWSGKPEDWYSVQGYPEDDPTLWTRDIPWPNIT
jgi:hypothetical protein